MQRPQTCCWNTTTSPVFRPGSGLVVEKNALCSRSVGKRNCEWTAHLLLQNCLFWMHPSMEGAAKAVPLLALKHQRRSIANSHACVLAAACVLKGSFRMELSVTRWQKCTKPVSWSTSSPVQNAINSRGICKGPWAFGWLGTFRSTLDVVLHCSGPGCDLSSFRRFSWGELITRCQKSVPHTDVI